MKKISLVILIITLIILPCKLIYAEEIYKNVVAQVIENNGIKEHKTEEGNIEKIENVSIVILNNEYSEEEIKTEYIVPSDESTKIDLREDRKILIDFTEQDGEIVKINIKQNIFENYIEIILLLILYFALILIIKKVKGRKLFYKSLIIYIFSLIISLIFIIKKLNYISVISIIFILASIYILINKKQLRKRCIIIFILHILSAILLNKYGIDLIKYIYLDNNYYYVEILKISMKMNEIILYFTNYTFNFIWSYILIFVVENQEEDKNLNEIKEKNIIDGKRTLRI